MIKQTHLKQAGLMVGMLAILAGCTTTSKIEEPEVVIEKALTQAPGAIEGQTTFDLEFKDPETGAAGVISFLAKEKSNMEDPANIQSDSSFDITADVTVPQGGQSQNVKVDAGFNVLMIGKDLYGTLTELNIGGNIDGLEQVNAMLPIFVSPYMNKMVHLPLEKLEAMAAQADPSAPEVDYDSLEAYANDGMRQDLADSKMLVVSEDMGVEKVKAYSGKNVTAYHYKVNIDPDGFETFFRAMNEELQLMSDAELNQAFAGNGEVSLNELVDVLNEAMNLELWIGQDDYHVYKMELSSDLTKVTGAISKLEEMTPEQLEVLEKAEFSMTIAVETAPIKAFTLDKPADDDVVDLGPILDLAVPGMPMGGQMMPEMSDEELDAMMQGFDFSELEGVEGMEGMEDFESMMQNMEDVNKMMEGFDYSQLEGLEGMEGMDEFNKAMEELQNMQR